MNVQNKKPDMFEILKKKLVAMQGIQHSTTEIDNSTKTNSKLITPQNKNGLLKGLQLFDAGEKTTQRKKQVVEIARKEKKALLSSIDWPVMYRKDEDRDYKKEVIGYMVAITELDREYSNNVPGNECIRNHVLQTIDESLLSEEEKRDKREDFLLKTISAYLGFCKARVDMLKECGVVPDDFKKAIYKSVEDAYILSFQTTVKSVQLRNNNIIKKLGKKVFKKLWEKNGFCREKCINLIEKLSNTFADYFREASMEEKANFHRIMHPNAENDSGMGAVLNNLEYLTDLQDTAINITKYV